MVYADPYDMAARFNLNGLGWTYIGLAILWTILLFCGVVFLVLNRRLPFLRIRNLPLSVSAVATLHVYWCLCMIAYVLNGFFPCATEYWIMSLYLPLGIALYQAGNTQLLQVAGVQEKFASTGPSRMEKACSTTTSGWRQLLRKWYSYPATQKAMTSIAVGMVVQLICATFAFLISRRFHPGWGLTGKELSAAQCRRGWPWWPSIVWQFTWSWIYAPYLLWKIRGVKDTYCWRLQTMLCCFAGLPGSPMWLVALYVKDMAPVNRYFPAPLWFSLSIALMEASVIFIPCSQVLKNRKLKRETLQIIAEWENKQKDNSSIGSDSTKAARISMASQKLSLNSNVSNRRGEMYTMHALEKALETNSTPLLLFAALKDFSGENISFLSHVRDWKANWSPPTGRYGLLRKPEINRLDRKAFARHQFSLAVEIYSSFVSLQYSDFPINLSSAHHKELEAMFDGAAALTSAHLPDDAVTPFDSYWSSKHSLDIEASSGKDQASLASVVFNNSTERILPSPERKHRSDVKNTKLVDLRTNLPPWVEVPDAFGPNVFDNAEESIKYMVLTNTWPKFVTAGYTNRMQKDSLWASVKSSAAALADVYCEQWTRLTGK